MDLDIEDNTLAIHELQTSAKKRYYRTTFLGQRQPADPIITKHDIDIRTRYVVINGIA